MDVDDSHHHSCLAAAGKLPGGPLVTTWPCFTEAMYLLGEVGGHRYQARLWTMLRLGRLNLLDLNPQEVDRMDSLMARYENVPMDLADASLVAAAEARSYKKLFTLDSDFYIYRRADGSVIEVIP